MNNLIDCPTKSYSPGKPNGKCWSNGHYLCDECKHLNPIFLNKQNLDNALNAQGWIQIFTLKN
jgi:hypothetical protein